MTYIFGLLPEHFKTFQIISKERFILYAKKDWAANMPGV